MGAGDIKFMAMIGAFLGWQKAIFTFFAAPFLGLILGLLNLLLRKDRLIPYGPFLALAALIMLFWADKIAALLTRAL
jgi:leader peptidase (prepilin peptidase)/N-methyltransferase